MTHPNEEPERKQHKRKVAIFNGFEITYDEHYDTSGSVTQRDIVDVKDDDGCCIYATMQSILPALSATWDELIDAAPTTTTLS